MAVRNILVVEDQALARMYLCACAEKCADCRVAGALTRADAALSRCGDGQIDLILMDIEMPGMNGLDAARAVLEQRPECKVIFITAYSLFQYAHEAVHLGACDYLLKLVDPDELEASVRRAMRQIETERKLEELAAALDEDRIQLAIVDENCARRFQWTPLTDAPLVAVTPPDFPWTGETISLARLMQEPFLSCPEQYVEQYLPADTPRLEVTASDDGAILSMVAGGLGVSVLSAYSLAGYENQVRVIPLDQPLSRRLGVAVKAMPAANSPARLFLSFLKRQYQNAR